MFISFPSKTKIQSIEHFLNQNNFRGSILIAQNGQIFLKKGYGLANEEHQIPNTPLTNFRVGSITKQFTAAAILDLNDKGSLKIEDTIDQYLPDYPNGHLITIHHLLSHSSGIPSITKFENLEEIQRHPATVFKTLDYFKDLPLEFVPGTDSDYSDSGYLVLGAIIESVSGDSYNEYLQKNLLDPLKMDATFVDHPCRLIPHRASGYRQNDQRNPIHSNYLDISFPHAAGALSTTVEDLYKWDQALKKKKILFPESVDLLFQTHSHSAKNKINYGYGFFIGPFNEELEKAPSSLIGHYGTIEGFRAASYRYPDVDLTVILLSNDENTDINFLSLEIAHIFNSRWRF